MMGSMLPVLSKYVSFFKLNDNFLHYITCFGIGVVIATAFIQMIPPAFDQLSNPCLNVPYDGLAMVFVLGTN